VAVDARATAVPRPAKPARQTGTPDDEVACGNPAVEGRRQRRVAVELDAPPPPLYGAPEVAPPRGMADVLAGAWGLGGLAVFALVRPWRRALLVFGVGFVGLLGWWSTLRPSNDRDWTADVARLPRAELRGDQLTIENVRNFDYRSETDFTPHWETRTFDLSRFAGLDLFMSYWGSPSIAHTIMSWEFDDGPPLAISIETRKERDEAYSPVAGFFRQYEIYYVVTDERDLVRLRTNYRGEQVYLYHLRTPKDRARRMLLDYVDSFNALVERPAFYNALTDNCTTTIRTHVKHIGAAMPWDWRLLANGYLDEMLYERAVVATGRPFAALKADALVNARAREADQDPEFSRRIREGLAPRPPS
jgi:hypothetical protein